MGIQRREDISCCCRCCCLACTVWSVDDCGTSLAIAALFQFLSVINLGWIYTLFCWEPKKDRSLHSQETARFFEIGSWVGAMACLRQPRSQIPQAPVLEP